MNEQHDYNGWKLGVFWLLWGLLLVPGYFAAFGTWLIGSMLGHYHELVDIVLTLIMAVALLSIAVIAIYSAWHCYQRSKTFGHLLAFLLLGIVGIPLLAGLGAILSYVKLTS